MPSNQAVFPIRDTAIRVGGAWATQQTPEPGMLRLGLSPVLPSVQRSGIVGGVASIPAALVSHGHAKCERARPTSGAAV